MSCKVTKSWPISDDLDTTVSHAKIAELIKMLFGGTSEAPGMCHCWSVFRDVCLLVLCTVADLEGAEPPPPLWATDWRSHGTPDK